MPNLTLTDARVIQIHRDQTLLTQLEQAQLGVPSSCRNGTCRTCRIQLQSGQVSYRIEWPGLSAEEKAQGWVLPCVAYPASDLVLMPLGIDLKD